MPVSRVLAALVAILLAGPATAVTLKASVTQVLTLISINGPDPATDILIAEDYHPGWADEAYGDATASYTLDISDPSILLAPQQYSGTIDAYVAPLPTEQSSSTAISHLEKFIFLVNESTTEDYTFSFSWDVTYDFSFAGNPTPYSAYALFETDDLCGPGVSVEVVESGMPVSAAGSYSCLASFTLAGSPGSFEYEYLSVGFNMQAFVDAEPAAVVPLPGALWFGFSGLAALGGVSVFRRRR